MSGTGTAPARDKEGRAKNQKCALVDRHASVRREEHYHWDSFNGEPCHPETAGKTDADGSCYGVATGDAVALYVEPCVPQRPA